MRASLLAVAVVIAAMSSAFAAGGCDDTVVVTLSDADGETSRPETAVVTGPCLTEETDEGEDEDLGGVSINVKPEGKEGDLAGVKAKVLELEGK